MLNHLFSAFFSDNLETEKKRSGETKLKNSLKAAKNCSKAGLGSLSSGTSDML